MNCGQPKDTALRLYLLMAAEGTRALIRTVLEVNSNFTVIVAGFFFFVLFFWCVRCRNQGEASTLNRLSPDFDCFHRESVRLNLWDFNKYEQKKMKCYFYFCSTRIQMFL